MASTSQQLSCSELCCYLVEGKIAAFEAAIARNQTNVLELRIGSEKEDTVLHIAATSGQVHMVYHILSEWPELMTTANLEGDLPIHSALKCGKFGSVDFMIKWLCLRKEIGYQVFGWKNHNDWSTPLHIALEYDLQETAKGLVKLYPRASYAMNKEGICPLYMAIQKQNLELVRGMLSKLESSVPKRDALASLSKGKSVLHAAVNYHQTENSPIEILKEMLGYDDEVLIKIKDPQGWTALSCAALSGSFEKVKIFTETVPNTAFVSNKDESFPIHAAVYGGISDIIDLLKNTWSLLDAKYRNILHVAVLTESSRIVSHLLANPEVEERSLINQKDKNGNTPLHLATLAKCVEVVRILIQDNRVNITLSNKEGLIAKDLAKKLMDTNPDNKEVQKLYLMFERATKDLKNYKIHSDLYGHLVKEAIAEIEGTISNLECQFKDLISLEDGNNVLHFASTVANPTHFIALLGDVSIKHWTALMEQANLDGDLPIHLAAKAGKLQNLETLMQSQNYNRTVTSIHICERKNRQGNTALHEAVLNGHGDRARSLFENHKAAAYCLNKDQMCPLFLFIKNLYDTRQSMFQATTHNDLAVEMIKALEDNEYIQNGLKNTKSVIHMAILARKKEIIKLIIDKASFLVDSIDSRGRSPLSYAAYIGYFEGVSLLLNLDTNLQFKRDKDIDGSFPIHYAAKGGQLEVVKLLTLSKILLKNNKQQNALHVAAEAGKSNVIKFLLKQPEFKELVNTGDSNGNTPLHLAVEGFHYWAVRRLVTEKRNVVNSTNNELLTPQDLFQSHQMFGDDKSQLFDLKSPFMNLLLKKRQGKESILIEKGNDGGGQAKAKENTSSNSSSKPNIWQIANILLVAATLMIGTSYTAILKSPFDGKEGLQNKTLYYSPYVTFYFSIIAALSLIAAVILQNISKLLVLCGTFFLYYALIPMATSSMAALDDVGRESHSYVTLVKFFLGPVLVQIFGFPVLAYYLNSSMQLSTDSKENDI